MKQTSNLKLNKPSEDDYVDIEVLNNNMDTIDKEITDLKNNGGTSGVINNGTAVDDHVAIFDGKTGKVIKDSGFTIGSSVPLNAVFTDFTGTTESESGKRGYVPKPNDNKTNQFLCSDGTWKDIGSMVFEADGELGEND